MASTELTTYIQDELKKGITPEVITANLLSKGWSQADIIAALQSIAPSSKESLPTPPLPPTPGNTQQYYVQQPVPVESKGQHPGRTEGIIGIICAVIALLFFPPVFGTVGIILGIIAHKKGEKTLGLVAIILSAIFLVIGMILGIWVSQNLKQAKSATGMVGQFLFP